MEKIKIGILGFGGVLGAGVFLVSMMLLYKLVPGVSLLYDYVSNYANSEYGAFLATGFIFHGITNLGIALGINLISLRSMWTRAGVLFFATSAVGVILAAIFPTDALGTNTTNSLVHYSVVTGGFIAESVALWLLAYGFTAESQWLSYARFTKTFAIIVTISLVVFWLAVYVRLFPGLAERIVLGVFLLWEIVTAIKLINFKKSAQSV